MGNDNEMEGPCVCGCYGHEHNKETRECGGLTRDETGSYVECECKEFVPAVQKGGWGAENRRLDMIEAMVKLGCHASMMIYYGTMENNDEFGKLKEEFDAIKLRVAKMKFAYRE